MRNFQIPAEIYIVKNDGMTQNISNYEQDCIPLILSAGEHPDNCGYETVATITVEHNQFVTGGTPEEFLYYLKQRAYEAFEAGVTTITL